jgi:hypothetical protein
MNKVHHHNTTAAPMYVGGVMIPPGAARLVDARLVPGAKPKTEPLPEGDPLLDILDGSVPEVVARLDAVSAVGLNQLEAAEKNGKTRKGVLAGIAEERLRRATFQPSEDQIAALQTMSDEDLQKVEEESIAFGGQHFIDAIETERKRRAAESDKS